MTAIQIKKIFKKTTSSATLVAIFLFVGSFVGGEAAQASSAQTSGTYLACAKVGACLYITLPARLAVNSSSTLEIWKAYGDSAVIFTVFKNSQISFNFAKTTSVQVNVFGSMRPTKEISTGPDGKKTYQLLTNYIQSNGDVASVLITSNSSILANKDVMLLLSGRNPASTTLSSNVSASNQKTASSPGWGLLVGVVLVFIILITIAILILIHVLRKR